MLLAVCVSCSCILVVTVGSWLSPFLKTKALVFSNRHPNTYWLYWFSQQTSTQLQTSRYHFIKTTTKSEVCLGVGAWVNNLSNRLTSTILETSLFAFSKHQNLNWSNGLSTSLYYTPTDSHSYLAVVFIFPFITSQEFHTFFSISDFVLYVVMTLIFQKIICNVPVFQ